MRVEFTLNPAEGMGGVRSPILFLDVPQHRRGGFEVECLRGSLEVAPSGSKALQILFERASVTREAAEDLEALVSLPGITAAVEDNYPVGPTLVSLLVPIENLRTALAPTGEWRCCAEGRDRGAQTATEVMVERYRSRFHGIDRAAGESHVISVDEADSIMESLRRIGFNGLTGGYCEPDVRFPLTSPYAVTTYRPEMGNWRSRPVGYRSKPTHFEGSDATCAFNALDSRLRCAVNPCGPCEGCVHYEKRGS